MRHVGLSASAELPVYLLMMFIYCLSRPNNLVAVFVYLFAQKTTIITVTKTHELDKKANKLALTIAHIDFFPSAFARCTDLKTRHCIVLDSSAQIELGSSTDQYSVIPCGRRSDANRLNRFPEFC